MLLRERIILIASLINLITNISGIVQARSVYVIADTTVLPGPPPIIQAYRIQDGNLVYLTQYESHHHAAIGLAIDTDSEYLFVTHEYWGTSYPGNLVEIINAKTMEYVDTVSATGATNLAGIVVDQGKQKVYAVDRGKKYLYIYNWDANIPELVQEGNWIELEGLINNLVGGAWAIAIDEQNHRLWVTSNETKVRFYDTNDWSHDPNTDYIIVSHEAIGIAVDVNNGYVYTGSAQIPPPGTNLSRYDLSADPNTAEATVDVNSPVLGIAVDQQTGLVYLTTYGDDEDNYYPNPPKDRLMVYDSNLSCLWVSDDIGNPAGVAVAGNVSCKPALLTLSKIDDVNDGNCVLPGDYITYRITYGPNGVDHNNVVITDHLPCQVDYINPFDPNYDDANRTYKWQIGSLSASAPNDFVTLTVCVNLGVGPNGIITNYCEIESDQYFSSASADTSACFWSPDIIYVDVNAVGCGSGLSWEHADPDLQSALQKAQAWDVNQIWVAVGTYKPTTTSARSISFELLDSVAIYGGFAGTESHPNQRDLTDPNNETILSGDIGTPDYQYDNSYHVVKCVDVNNAVLDGFTITAGNANADYPDEHNQCGGGIFFMDSNNLIVRKCISTKNSSLNYGGGLFNASSNTNVINCIFIDNTVDDYGGGGICICYEPNPIVANCVFSGNRSGLYAGGLYNYQSSPTIINCSFSNNSAIEGGAVYNNYYSEPNIINCFFNGNTADKYGGGMVNSNTSSPSIINCIFSGNCADSNGGGAICNWNCSDPNITNCTLSNNSAWDGGAVYNYYSEPNITYCIFTGNTADHYGGGMHNYYESYASVVNSIFSGNRAEYYGGGIANSDNSNLTLTNCTVSENLAIYGGGICSWNDVNTNLTNCILWDNEATYEDDIWNNSYLSVTYCDVKGWSGGDENINEDPCFFSVEQPDGSWTEDASYDGSTFQSTLTNAGTTWAVNELVGRFINPDTSQALHFFIVSNDVNTIKVWSDVNSIAGYGDTYQIYDYHLKLESVCIDAGYPQGDYIGQTDIDGEPRVFDGDNNDVPIVDMGADEYYWSPADFNSDGLVNFFDYALLANVWLTTPQDVNYYDDIYDLIDNNCIDSSDLARFCEDWLWQTAWVKTFPFAYETMGCSMGESLGLTQELFPSASAKQDQPELTAADVEEIIKWLEELWLTDDQVRKVISADEWLEFIEEVIQLAKQEIQY